MKLVQRIDWTDERTQRGYKVFMYRILILNGMTLFKKYHLTNHKKRILLTKVSPKVKKKDILLVIQKKK